MTQVLVLNASYEPLNVTSVRRAHVLVFKGKAEVIEALDQSLHSATDTYPWPHVIRLVTYVSVPRTVQRKISRRALFARDGWRCAYCGGILRSEGEKHTALCWLCCLLVERWGVSRVN